VRRLRFGFGILLVLGMAPAMFADISDFMLNINGTTYCPAGTGATCSSDGGFAAAGVSSTLDTTFNGSGLGTVSFAYNPGPGTYNVNLWLFEQLSEQNPPDNNGPGDNEYGKVSGTPVSGQTYQIDVPDYDSGGDPNTSAEGNIVANTAASTLNGHNDVPGTDDCASTLDVGPNCTDYTSMALGFKFTLAAGQEELISFNVSTTKPTSGFYLEQIHQADDPDGDGTNPEFDYYFTGSATAQPIVVGAVPEPGSILLLATMAGILMWAFRSRVAALKAGK
jgi:hypothetical protein